MGPDTSQASLPIHDNQLGLDLKSLEAMRLSELNLGCFVVAILRRPDEK
jgi:hypothetical protein